MENATPRAGIYCRLSLAAMGDTTHVDEQEQVCRRLLPPAATVAYQHVYKDNSRSAWRRDRRRPGWEALVEAIRGGELDMVAIYHGDRLVRQPRDLEDLIDVGSERGITIVSPTGTYNLADPDHQMSAPRARGDGPWRETLRHVEHGCSPRTRGWSLEARKAAAEQQVLPAHAGMVPPVLGSV